MNNYLTCPENMSFTAKADGVTAEHFAKQYNAMYGDKPLPAIMYKGRFIPERRYLP